MKARGMGEAEIINEIKTDIQNWYKPKVAILNSFTLLNSLVINFISISSSLFVNIYHKEVI